MKQESILAPNNQDVTDALAAAQDRLLKERKADSSIANKLKPDDKSDEEKKKRFAREFLVMRIFERNDIIELLKQVKLEYFK
jgi:hypothetical protein